MEFKYNKNKVFKLIDDAMNKWQEIHYITEPKDGPLFITREGKMIWCDETHTKIVNKIGINLYYNTEVENLDYLHMWEFFEEELGWIRCNSGTTGYEGTTYVAIDKNAKPTEEQYKTLEDVLYYYFTKRKYIEVWIISNGSSNIDEKNWYYNEFTTPEDIIKSIKRYFQNGLLEGFLLHEVYPNKGESKKDFLRRFMSVTAKEYPDTRQRFAVANSYWDRRHTHENINESTEKVDIEQVLKDNFKSDTPPQRCFILKDGTFIECIKDERYHTHQNHAATSQWLFKNGYVTDDAYRKDEIKLITELGAITCNGYGEFYCGLLKDRPTEEQFESLTEWLDVWYFTHHYDFIVRISTTDNLWAGEIITQKYYHNTTTVDELISKIKRYYVSGVLLEDLQQVDSEGNPLNKEQIEFFKDSKVRNKNGNLLVCGHHTNKEFQVFDISKAGQNFDGYLQFGKGFYFTQNNRDNWTSFKELSRNKKLFYLNIINPFNTDDKTAQQQLFDKANEIFDFKTVKNKAFKKLLDDYVWCHSGALLFQLIKDINYYNNNIIDTTQLLKELGFDGIIQPVGNTDGDYNQIVAFEPNQIKSITNTNPSNSDNINEDKAYVSELNEELLLEKSRNELINKSKTGANYKTDQTKGKNRWERKKYSRVANTVREFNSIDMNAFFKKDFLAVNIPVKGETDNYQVKIRFNGVLKEIQQNVKAHDNTLDYKTIMQSLTRVFNNSDVYVSCTCPDFFYRFGFVATIGDYNSGQPQLIPADETNPNDSLGAACKHVNLVLSNLFWLMKVASVINNYIHFAEENMQRQFAEIIFPKLYGLTYPKAYQLGFFDRNYLQHSKGLIDTINEKGRTRGRFQSTKPQEEEPVEIQQTPKKFAPINNKEETEIKTDEIETPTNNSIIKEPKFITQPKQLSFFDDEDLTVK